ncbi:hypothetical protein PRIPAC_71339 [Pristionchus pacificus]|uniref:Uncharacterized protein n=1 Tax=Pristionchus pacificus TaxID=54126 RepID=A0A2A6CFG5_PRIPA|nr:hypothetical protein PRIPAC_71339 [Pristionchus pacificus]|eukprot:PDM76828.1 hypothetical protein PRIPAC_42223 [Pristionchus pacificus]
MEYSQLQTELALSLAKGWQSRTELASSLAKGSWGLGRTEQMGWGHAYFFGSPSAPRAFRQGLAGSLRSHAC